jgi:glutamate racemase
MTSPACDITALEAKENLSVVIVDSGMGGLSICADMAVRLERRRCFGHVAITYFNAWPEQQRGYNSLPSDVERIRVFDNALAGALAFAPDIILIACNTLSVLYPRTAFSRNAAMPLVGIVDFGVDMIHAYLAADPGRQVIILGTLTTIAADSHRSALAARGIAAERMVPQACDQLATEIEKDPHGAVVGSMIDDFIGQAAARLADPRAPVAAALCCTHYGYSAELIQESLATRLGAGATILNPNTAMAEGVFASLAPGRCDHTEIDIAVVSRILWSDQKLKSMARALTDVSPATAQALLAYRHDPALFSV